ncbi:hypothetical protein ACI65C_013481 [Semiaphis heraclei]
MNISINSDDLPSSFKNIIVKNCSTTIVRLNLNDMHDIGKWVAEFSIKTNTRWNVRTTVPNGKYIQCKKNYICHHSSHHKVDRTLNKKGQSKNTDCKASIKIVEKVDTVSTRKSDPFVKNNYLGMITISNTHNHNINTAEALGYLNPDVHLRKTFEELLCRIEFTLITFEDLMAFNNTVTTNLNSVADTSDTANIEQNVSEKDFMNSAQKDQVSTPMNESQNCDGLIVESTLDIGYYINVHSIRDDLRLKLLTTPYVLSIDYDFKKDEDTAAKRGFSRTHLERYQWMVYSPIAKGVLCKYCVLFRPTLLRGTFGAFIIRGFKNFYQIHEEAKKLLKVDGIKDVTEQLNSSIRKLIDENRLKLVSIIKTIVYCGTHDIALRGKHSNEEPVVNKLQSVKTNLYTVHQYIKTSLLSIFRMHRTQCDRHFNNIFETIKKTTNDLDIEIKIPRLSNKQTNRSNHNVTTLEQYYRVSLFLPYLDSLINSLESRFTQSNEIPFKISNLHPSEVIKLSKSDFICTLKNIKDLYNIDNLIEEGNTWYDYWNITENSTKINEECNISYYLKDCEFFPSVKKCIIIYMTIPPTTCTIERSFSTLRRVKTWLRSTMTEQRLSGLCILSIHRQKIDDLNLIQGVVDEFSKNKRNLHYDKLINTIVFVYILYSHKILFYVNRMVNIIANMQCPLPAFSNTDALELDQRKHQKVPALLLLTYHVMKSQINFEPSK